MIYFCPNCGVRLKLPLKDGITSCENCPSVFDTSSRNLILATAWLIRRWKLEDKISLEARCGINESQFEFLNHHIIENNLNHDELISLLKTVTI